MPEQPDHFNFIQKRNCKSAKTEALALLKILALGSKQIAENKVQRPEDVLKRIRKEGSITC